MLACLLPLAALLTGCGKSSHTVTQAPPSVTVSHPRQEQVTDYLDLTGTIAAFQSVDLVARVTGYLKEVKFQDGGMVEKDQELFVIEREPYEQQLALAKAALERAKSEYQRQLSLMASNATSKASVERWLSERDQAVAQVELAKINLSYTIVNAPFNGRVGRHLVDADNLVGPGVVTKLATIEQIEPIYVYFNLNERDALEAAAVMRRQGTIPRASVGKAPVLVGLQNQEGYPQEGTLDFVDTGMSTSSGTLQMRAVFPNKDRALVPGAFARVRIPLGDPKPMLVVPNRAIGNDQEGDYVLVVGADNVVARRAVEKGALTKNGRAIRTGLTAEDQVIVNGIARARPGAKVTPTSEPAPTHAAR